MNRRNFLKLGALFVPAALVEPRRADSFIWARPPETFDVFIGGKRAQLVLGETLELSIGGRICPATDRFPMLKERDGATLRVQRGGVIMRKEYGVWRLTAVG